MKVFVIVSNRWDEWTEPSQYVEKVLSSREKAEQWIKKHKEEPNVRFHISEWNVEDE